MRKVDFVSMKTWKTVKRWAGQASVGKWPEKGLPWGDAASGTNGQNKQIRKGTQEAVKPCDETVRAALPDENKISNDGHD
jgi:hypothetical protein